MRKFESKKCDYVKSLSMTRFADESVYMSPYASLTIQDLNQTHLDQSHLRVNSIISNKYQKP